MPIVDDSTGEPVSDEPEQGDVEARGGKVEGDPGIDRKSTRLNSSHNR
jgi:hypothetical protein